MTDANKAPCYPWYPKDFSADEPVQLMTLAEEGAYRRLLDHQWLHGSVPGEIGSIARICKNVSEREMRKMWPKIEPLFMRMEGQPPRLQNRRLERVRMERKAFLDKQSASGRRGAEARWGRRGEDGDPIAPAMATPLANECLASAVAIAKQPDRRKKTVRDDTWLTPYADHWSRRCGNPPFGKLASILAPLHKEHGAPETLARWSRYLDSTEPKFCSVHRFAETFNSWAAPTTMEMTDEFGAMQKYRKGGVGEADWVLVA